MAESSEFFLFVVPYHFCEWVFLNESEPDYFFSSISGHGFDKEGYDTLIEAQYKAVTEMQPSEYQYMSAHLDCNKVCNFFFTHVIWQHWLWGFKFEDTIISNFFP